MVVKAPPKSIRKSNTSLSVVLLAGTGFWQFDADRLWQLGLFFTEAGAFVFGNGLAIIPFLQAGVVGETGWLKPICDSIRENRLTLITSIEAVHSCLNGS